tara:strand:+ start:593 stop:1093 length:501 start_codon:yes stop_codon:yes gene_type:complete
MKKEIFPITLVLILALSRLIPHPPNFTPIIAVAIMSAYFFKNVYFSLAVLLISMFISDIFIGFYNNMFLIYFTISFIALVFFQFAKNLNSKNLLVFGLVGSVIFFIISNFGVWLFGSLYEKNLNGLIYCYTLAIPFFVNTLVSTILYSYLGYYANRLMAKKLLNTS